ncbi:MAG: ferrous iron transporter B, partial [Armatimonadetes bacterium]|nr:ferrous iron transporter B [Armatimonadota bacterium]
MPHTAPAKTPISPNQQAIVAFVGNPNAGKTSLFNALTGASQKVGNYPGVTVEKVSANLTYEGRTFEFVDVPGLYSMKAVSEDEIVARDSIMGEHGLPDPDLLVCVMDAASLERHLFFFSQLVELNKRMIVAKAISDSLSTELPKNEAAPRNLTPSQRYEWAAQVNLAAIEKPTIKHVSTTQKIDRILTHRFFGLVIFVATMYLVFQSIYTLSAPLQDLIDKVFTWLASLVGPKLESIPWLQSLVVDGILMGIGSVFSFLPQIVILFALIAALEGSGYLARAAFLMDRLLGWCGLSGRAFVPLLSSFACAIPGIMAARVMPDPKSRLATILVAPLMSCSARLPVYVLLIGAIIQPRFGSAWAGFTLFAMHFLGLIVAIPVVLIINRTIIRGKSLPFVLELPRYQWPKLRDVWLSMYMRGVVFVKTAGTVIVVMSLVIWAMLYFPRSPELEKTFRNQYEATTPEFQAKVTEDNYVLEKQTETSYLGRFGKAIEPAFRPLGFDWRLSTAILCAFP